MCAVRFFLCISFGVLLSGCAFPRPLQNDVTGLPLADVVHKITCEARDALEAQLKIRKVASNWAEYKEAKSSLKALTARVLKPWDSESKQLDQRKADLLQTKILLSTELDATFEVVKSLFKRAKQYNEEKNPIPDELKKKRTAIFKRRIELSAQWEKFNFDLAAYMRAVTNLNNTHDAAKKRVDVATKQFNERFKDLVRYYNHDMALGFRFKVTETDDMPINASWKLPLVFNGIPGSWTIGPKFGDTRQRLSERKVNLDITFDGLEGTECGDAPSEAGIVRAHHYPITGNIGIEEVIAQYFDIVDRAKRDSDTQKGSSDDDEAGKTKPIFAKTDAYTDALTFTTTLSGSVTPSIILTPTLREQFTGSVGASATREDVHVVTISLLPVDSGPSDKDADKITKVQIIQDGFVSH